ncbi:MAG: orotidine-5'-phosphate decarboxylase [Acidobacteriota bacterium]|jgi:orotidine-5'-phosphate decarboxylase|nr:orotidine-5'-phosphate decarboxylase [Acidobacteriota bacterium]
MNDRIITALDVDSPEEASSLLAALEAARIFKLGLQAWLRMGPGLADTLRQHGKELFLDLKFKDIPNTVAAAVRAVLPLSPRFLTIHLSGGGEMVRAAAEAAAGSNTTILGVTVLTSLSDADLAAMGGALSATDTVLRLCELGIKNQVSAVVCSAREIKPLRERFGRDLILVTPGIRPADAAAGDQKRTMTPEEAMAAGADYLVIGRPITQAPDPALAFRRIQVAITPRRPHPTGTGGPSGFLR